MQVNMLHRCTSITLNEDGDDVIVDLNPDDIDSNSDPSTDLNSNPSAKSKSNPSADPCVNFNSYLSVELNISASTDTDSGGLEPNNGPTTYLSNDPAISLQCNDENIQNITPVTTNTVLEAQSLTPPRKTPG